MHMPLLLVRSLCLATLTLIALLIVPESALAQAVSVRGSLRGAAGYSLLLVAKDGSSKSVKLTSSGAFTFSKISTRALAGSSLQLIGTDGRYFGPVVLGRKGTKVSTTLSGKNTNSSAVINLGKLTLRTGFASAAGLKAGLYTTPQISADSSGKPTGAGNLGVVPVAPGSAGLRGAQVRPFNESKPGDDSDKDGVLNSVDADDNNNGVLDPADPASKGTDTPYVSFNSDFRRSLNAHIRSGLSDSAIDAVVSGQNGFSSTFFISLPQNSSINGGYIVCSDSLTYCRPNTPLGYSGGVSESSNAFRAPLSSLLNAQGFPRLERITVGGSFPAIVLSMEPRVGRDAFRAGDLYRIVLTSGSKEISSRTFALPPYFISVPAIKEYTANSITTVVDYDSLSPESGSVPGAGPTDPIILGSDGLLSVTFWRPQREPLASESGYQDFGGLNYGILVGQLQATCAGLYSNLSSELVEDPNALGNGGSPLANQGANLSPLVDQIGDRPASSAYLLSATVDLKTCISRVGAPPGTYSVALRAAGTEVTGGSNSAVQNIYVTIP